MTTGDFALEKIDGTVDALHRADLLADSRPRVVLNLVDDAALVLGSRQHAGLVDTSACRRAGIGVVKRRSGGGVVLVEPDAMCWFDVVVPANVGRFASVMADVRVSMRWMGGQLAAALQATRVADASVHGDGMMCGTWGDLICFAGVGPGEVILSGRKLVGISQRRTRAGVRFQCMVHVRWRPDVLVGLLATPRPRLDELEPVGVVSRQVADALPGALVRVLNAATR